MNDEQKDKWWKIGAKGQLRYIVIEGILKRGLSFAVVMGIFNYYWDYGFNYSKLGDVLTDSKNIFDFLFNWLFFGLLIGFVAWHFPKGTFRGSK